MKHLKFLQITGFMIALFMMGGMLQAVHAQKPQTLMTQNGLEVQYTITTTGDAKVATFTMPAASLSKMLKGNVETIELPQQAGFIFKHNAITPISGAILQVNSSQLNIDPNAISVVFSINMPKSTDENRRYTLDKVHFIKQ